LSKNKTLNKKSKLILRKSKKNLRKKITVFVEKISKVMIKNENKKKRKDLVKKKI